MVLRNEAIEKMAANVGNSTVRCLSNLPLALMMVNRHSMSSTVRDEVSPKSHEWGYRLGSVYILGQGKGAEHGSDRRNCRSGEPQPNETSSAWFELRFHDRPPPGESVAKPAQGLWP